MAKQKWTIYIGLVLLTSLAILLCLISTREETAPFSLEVATAEGQEQILLWKQESGGYYGFLPAFSEMENTYIRLNTDNAVKLNGILLENGMDCSAFSADEPQTLTYTAWGRECTETVTFLRSANIASMHIDTQSGSMEYIHEEKGNEEPGNMRIYADTGAKECTVELSIKGRGNTSWRKSEKKPYSIALTEQVDLLGMGQANNWILLANSDDYSNMRNKIVLDFASELGLLYSPEADWIDLYLNGTYMGVYLLCERNEVHPQRVDIVHENSFLVSLENELRMKNQNISYISTNSEKHLRVHYYEKSVNETIAKLTSVWQSVENAIENEAGIDSLTGKSVGELIDVESWVAKYLIEEIFGNIDAANLSQFFYYDGNRNDGAIAAGPVWDYDHSLGNKSEWQLTIENALFANREVIEEGFSTPWFFYLSEKKFFYDELCNTYVDACLPILDELIDSKLAIYWEQIKVASRLNQIRWNLDELDVLSEFEYVQDFLRNRIDFLNKVWVDNAPYFILKARNGFEGYYGYYAVFEGETLPELPMFENTAMSVFLGWYYTETDTPVDFDQPITEDIEIYAKWEETPTKRIKQVAKLMPLGVIAVMGATLVVIEVRRWRKRR